MRSRASWFDTFGPGGNPSVTVRIVFVEDEGGEPTDIGFRAADIRPAKVAHA